MTILAIFCALIVSSWIGMYVGNRGLRKQLEAAETRAGIWKAETERVERNLGAAEDKIDKLKAQQANTNAALVRAHRQIERHDRVRDENGRFTGAAK